jgi:hypothetical protein
MVSFIESLPFALLERVCENLVDVDESATSQSSLDAFSLTCRCTNAAAEAQKFSHIELKIRDQKSFEDQLRRWTELLAGGR